MEENKLYVIDWKLLQTTTELAVILQKIEWDYIHREKPLPPYLQEVLRIVHNALDEAHNALAGNEWIIDNYPETSKLKVPGLTDWEKEEDTEDSI